LFGLILTDIAGGPMGGPDMDWIDPGVFALIGCAAFFAGVTRLTMSLTVIMIEITNETHFLLPVMTAVVVAKLTADCCMESLYHCLIQFKCLPYLADELHAHVCLELHAVKEVMSNPAVSLPVYGSVAEIASLMVGNNHSAFPVTEKGTAGPVFKGTILRNHVTCILAREDLFVVVSPNAAKDAMERQESLQIDETNKQRYNVLGAEELANLDDKLPKFQISATDTGDREAMIARLTAPEFRDLYVNLSPYVDQSSYSVPETFSLERGYNLFRSMGLRHITVVDKFNFPVGMLSRKDLLHLNVEERMAKSKEAMQRKRTVTKELIDRARSNSLSLNPVSPPVWNTGVTPNSQQASPFSPVVNLDGSV
jgi:chloride channel 7